MAALLLLLLFVAPLTFAQELVFTGVPSVRIDADGKQSIKVDLSEQGAEKYTCRITKKGKRYYWASRGDRELIRSDAGDFVYFISMAGTGYVKVHSGTTPQPFDYMEHLTSGFTNITYWGSSKEGLLQKK